MYSHLRKLPIRILTALIALLLLRWLHHLSKAGWSLSNMACPLRLNLFTNRELTKRFNDPFGTPPLIPPPMQLTLALEGLGQAVIAQSRRTQPDNRQSEIPSCFFSATGISTLSRFGRQ
jgi:membrane-associated phospholipid phosphatase